MKIYLAGEPGGNKIEGEKRIIKLGGRSRLVSYFYKVQAVLVFNIQKETRSEQNDNK